MNTLIRLHPDDNVGVALKDLRTGEIGKIDGQEIPLLNDIALGHKVALEDFAPGQKILKFGLSIGSTTEAVKKGAWVHTHNLKSDYVPNYNFE